MNKVHKIKGFVYVTGDGLINNNDYITDGYLVWQWKDNSSLLGRNKVVLTNDPSLTIVQQLTPQDVEYLNTVDECEVLPFLSNNGIVLYGYKLQLPKQETIEEVGNNYANNFIDGKDHYYGFIEGYNHALKTLYTEEEVREMLFEALNEEKEKCCVTNTIDSIVRKVINQNKKK